MYLNSRHVNIDYTYAFGEIVSRGYRMGRRAEQAAETRARIVRAAVELHGSVGPARTTMSMLAERAGVQRNTLYSHFPDEWSVLLACSAHVLEADPLPDAAPWRAIADPAARLRAGLAAVYGWYARNAAVTGCVLRDAEQHEPVQRIAALRMGPAFEAYHEVLGEGLSRAQQAMLAVMLDFFAWRTLAERRGLDAETAVALAAGAVLAPPGP